MDISIAIDKSSNRQGILSRPVLSSSEFDTNYEKLPANSSSSLDFIKDATRLAFKDFTWKTYFLSFLPILSWLPKYNWKSNSINDLVAGFTVAVMHIPQVNFLIFLYLAEKLYLLSNAGSIQTKILLH